MVPQNNANVCPNNSHLENWIEKYYCGETLINLTSLYNSPYPELSYCFQRTVLLLVPCIFTWFSSIFIFCKYRKKFLKNPLPWKPLNISKIVICILICITWFIQILCLLLDNYPCKYPIIYTSPSIMALTMMLLTSTLWYLTNSGIITSGFIFISWFLFILCGIPEVVTSTMNIVQNGSNLCRSIVFVMYYFLTCVEFLLTCFADQSRIKETGNICPRKYCSYLNRLLYGWFWKLAVLGWTRSIVRDDLWILDKNMCAKNLIAQWDYHWEGQKRKLLRQNKKLFNTSTNERDDVTLVKYSPMAKSEHVSLEKDHEPKKATGGTYTSQKCPSIPWTLFLCFKWPFLVATLANFLSVLLQFAGPQLLKVILAYIQNPDNPIWIGILASLTMFFASNLQSFCQQISMNNMFIFGLKLKTILTAAIYKKALLLSNNARRNYTTGEIVNHMAVDIQRCVDVSAWIQNLWSMPLIALIALIFLYQIIGWAAFVGFSVMVILVPINFQLAKKQKENQVSQMKWKDDRIKIMSEILSGIKVIKLYAWEKPFERKIDEIRAQELKVLRKSSIITSWNFFTIYCSPFLVAVVSFAAFTLSDPNNRLTPQIAFVSLSLFNILRIPMNFLPFIVSMLVQANVSNSRLRQFLSLEERSNENVKRSQISTPDAIDLSISDGSFTWDKLSDDSFMLENINLQVKKGQLVAVIGQVGEGKSSLISAILGELETIKGSVEVNGTIAYVPQQAWITNTTLQKNILFTSGFNEKAYENVLKCCALTDDLAILSNGDQTEIGEKGVNLSGGQKQRVSLARAIYQNKDIYLLDDPLSAVDAHVGKHIFENVLSSKKGLLRNKTRILVTHALTFLKETDCIILMKDGKIAESGTFNELVNSDGLFAEYVATYMATLESDPSANKVEVDEVFSDPDFVNAPSIIRARKRSSGSVPRRSTERTTSVETSMSFNQGVKKPAEQSLTKTTYGTENILRSEKVAIGSVAWRDYKFYFSSIGYLVCLGVLCCYAISTAFGIGSNLWLAAWSSGNVGENFTTISANRTSGTAIKRDMTDLDIKLSVYLVLGLSQGLFIFMASILSSFATVAASRLLHKSILHSLLRSPMSFFDITPLGVIINRIGKDIDIVDNTVPDSMRQSLLAFLSVLSSLVIILISTPIIAVVIIPLSVFYYLIQKFYISTARQLKRLESASRSPIYSFFGETIQGVSSIRAYDATEWCLAECQNRIDYNQMAYFPALMATRWLAIYLQFIGNCLVFGATLFAVIRRTDNPIEAGLVGLSITYAMTMSMSLMQAVRTASDLETNIVAVERIKEYTDLPAEAPWITSIRPPQNWPSNGKIEFVDYSLRYKQNSTLALKNISCLVNGLEKVGIAGRTGAGKSSLSLALFRLVEPASGKIVIDDIDIWKIGLHDLRSKLAIIPQEPVLFSGSLRMNLDPFEFYADDQLWLALEQCHLKPYVSSLPGLLEYAVLEGGENLSVGQRQLICLARALLRKSKILIFDEATAAVDMETESLIQDTINLCFADCTILTIAHRLNTIMKSDRILVLSQGSILEFDSPNELLKNSDSSFYKMAKDAGLIE